MGEVCIIPDGMTAVSYTHLDVYKRQLGQERTRVSDEEIRRAREEGRP